MSNSPQQDIIKEIRTHLRLAMDGIVSTSMREKGVEYKLNFGVTLPRIKEIAKKYQKEATLANMLWKEDVRELKILATMLYPTECFTPEQAQQWVRDIRYMEIAEQYCANLMQEVSFAETMADVWIQDNEEFIQVTGFILYARLCTKGICPTESHSQTLLKIACTLLQQEYVRTQQIAIIALKRFGRQSGEQSEKVLSAIKTISRASKMQEIYADLKFEFDYYK